jgi:hypothetical protein
MAARERRAAARDFEGTGTAEGSPFERGFRAYFWRFVAAGFAVEVGATVPQRQPNRQQKRPSKGGANAQGRTLTPSVPGLSCILTLRFVVLRLRNTEITMAVSARLGPKTQLELARYCKAHGLTKTEALERGIALLLRYEGSRAHHPAFTSFVRLREQLSQATANPKPDSIDTLKRRLDEKYPG